VGTSKEVYDAVKFRSGGLCENITCVLTDEQIDKLGVAHLEFGRCCAPDIEMHHYPPRSRHSKKRYSYSVNEVFAVCRKCHLKAPRLRIVDGLVRRA
jgi:hypothetical protein